MNIACKSFAIATFVLTAGFGIFYPTTASAAGYNGACGAGYKTIDHMEVGTLGTVWLTYNASNGYNCVVTVRNNPGARMRMSTRIALAHRPWLEDTGDYTTYVGPRYLYARGHCISWSGTIGNVTNSRFIEHCG